jgi:hypothetical protein
MDMVFSVTMVKGLKRSESIDAFQRLDQDPLRCALSGGAAALYHSCGGNDKGGNLYASFAGEAVVFREGT